ncbi:transcriptional regulator, IclR family [Halopseudomonas litoralis]|uniref:Transcriptional regulator, IclR family n=1 Tax=Halopseudomonas litoralis TaxID=797277 RepID=A0A1H1XMS2_9GAMM|nr:IclR family transcriptional regulator [Halopseudomonas litoralis]SDT10514.1 transcriptional regulator, IclR family [Halopseudomonas litoralis]
MSQPHEPDHPRQAGIQVIARAAQIMRALGNAPQGLSLAAIAQEVDLPRSTVQRIINALADEMLVEHTGPGGVRLGPALGQLINQTQIDIISLTRPYLHELSDQLQESVCLCSLSGDKIYIIDRIVAERELRVVFPIGVYAPAYATSAGKVLLSEMPEASLRSLLPTSLPALTEKTLNLSQLLKQMEHVRQQKISSDMDECIDGVGSCAVALETYLGLFSLAVVGPTARMLSGVGPVSETLLRCKQDIERAIGHVLGKN